MALQELRLPAGQPFLRRTASGWTSRTCSGSARAGTGSASRQAPKPQPAATSATARPDPRAVEQAGPNPPASGSSACGPTSATAWMTGVRPRHRPAAPRETGQDYGCAPSPPASRPRRSRDPARVPAASSSRAMANPAPQNRASPPCRPARDRREPAEDPARRGTGRRSRTCPRRRTRRRRPSPARRPRPASRAIGCQSSTGSAMKSTSGQETGG